MRRWFPSELSSPKEFSRISAAAVAMERQSNTLQSPETVARQTLTVRASRSHGGFAITEVTHNRDGRFIHQLAMEIATMISEMGKVTEETKGTGSGGESMPLFTHE